MKSLKNLELSNDVPLIADELIEFHAARLLLLIRVCGSDGRIKGLTKMAKLDFFVRYPNFFAKLASHLNKTVNYVATSPESSMIRFHYGPWDQRYYHVLAYLESKNLINILKVGKAYDLLLTQLGEDISKQFLNNPAFYRLVEQMYWVKDLLGKKSGNQLKNLVYEVFDKEIAQLSLGEAIKE